MWDKGSPADAVVGEVDELERGDERERERVCVCRRERERESVCVCV